MIPIPFWLAVVLMIVGAVFWIAEQPRKARKRREAREARAALRRDLTAARSSWVMTVLTGTITGPASRTHTGTSPARPGRDSQDALRAALPRNDEFSAAAGRS